MRKQGLDASRLQSEVEPFPWGANSHTLKVIYDNMLSTSVAGRSTFNNVTFENIQKQHLPAFAIPLVQSSLPRWGPSFLQSCGNPRCLSTQ